MNTSYPAAATKKPGQPSGLDRMAWQLHTRPRTTAPDSPLEPIVKALAEAHGAASVSSVEGHGATITIRLPRAV